MISDTLPDGDYVVEPDTGVWLTVGGLSLRVRHLQVLGIVRITAYPVGREDDDPDPLNCWELNDNL